ncbi:MAG: DUF3549 family protein, partial [Pseudomonadales bacterium]
DSWTELGLQGIAELAVNSEPYTDKLIACVDKIPKEPLTALCNALEHGAINHKLANALYTKLESEIAKGDESALASSLMRAIQAGPNASTASQSIHLLLESALACRAEVIASIAIKGRAALSNSHTMMCFLEKLAIAETGQAGFSRILADLMFEAPLRQLIFECFRSPERSDALSHCIGTMFGNK